VFMILSPIAEMPSVVAKSLRNNMSSSKLSAVDRSVIFVVILAMSAVMELLGHSQINLTLNTYSYVLPSVHKETAAAMDRAGDNPATTIKSPAG